MRSQYLQNPPLTFRARTATLYTGFALLLAVSTLLSLALMGGISLLLAYAWGPLFLAYGIYYLLGQPSLRVGEEDILIRNPGRWHRITYAALIDVSTKYHLTLVTPQRRYQVFALPASGMLASLNASRQDLHNLPAISYKPGGGLATSDLPNSAAGASALVIRGYWQELVEAGALEDKESQVQSYWDFPGLLILLALLLASAAGFYWGSGFEGV